MLSFRWLWFDYSDPRLRLSRRERARVWAKMIVAHEEHRKPLRYGATCLTGFVAFCIICKGSTLLGVPLSIATMLALLLAWIAAACVGQWAFAPAMRRAMRHLGHDVCVACGYWLRGLPDSITRCPECGACREPMPHDATATNAAASRSSA